jgi:hypothetical protein
MRVVGSSIYLQNSAGSPQTSLRRTSVFLMGIVVEQTCISGLAEAERWLVLRLRHGGSR